VVTAGLVLFFLPDPGAALSAYRRILRPGGRLVLSSFAVRDPRYARAMKALTRFAHGADSPPQGHKMFEDETTLHAALGAAGYAPVSSSEQVVVSRFRDAAHWLEWVASHAGRQLVDRIPAESLAEATAAAGAELEAARADTGGLHLTTTIRITVAGSPALSPPNAGRPAGDG
jgi:hypothetical protein